ncbi:MAG: hypothetical protein ACREEB_03405 [Caulobacteraceae bacterium]
MTRKKMAFTLCAAALAAVSAGSSLAAAIGDRQSRKTAVTCAYDIVRSKPGVLSLEVYAVGTEKYVIEYKFREKGRPFVGGIGISYAVGDGYLTTNDAPAGQPDNHGLVELDFLGTETWDQMFKKCRLRPGFDDSIRNGPPPKWRRIQMPGPSD